jgi:hypothetical protein
MQEIENLERQMLNLISQHPFRDMSDDKAKSEVRDIFLKTQGFDKIPIPDVRYRCVSVRECFGCRVECLAGTSWENCACSAHLFLPLAPPPYPVVLCACGHGRDKLNYNRFGAYLAQRGIAVMIPDNIGQLERGSMGHWFENAPFDCGFSLIALMTQELLGTLGFLKRDSRFTRIGAAGNSGGGTLTMNLAALAPEYLEAIASTGYPSSFEWICRKRKRHCCCNLFPGVLGKIEHDELYSLFSPRPLLMMQGDLDNLIPLDVFRARTALIREVYRRQGAEDNYFTGNWHGPHPWNREAMEKMAEFFISKFNVGKRDVNSDDLWNTEDSSVFGTVYDKLPDWAVNTAQLAYRLSGRAVPEKLPELQDIWKCEYPDEEYPELYPGSLTQRILSQWRCFMYGFNKK